MTTRLWLGDLPIDVEFKHVKHVHLSVHPPSGHVRIAAPERMNLDTIRVYALSRLRWIKQQQHKFQQQERETPREYLERESHYLWGRRYLLSIVEHDAPPAVELRHRRLVLSVRPGTDEHRRGRILDAWYRAQLRQAVPPLLDRWQPRVAVEAERFYIQRMKTKWGSANPRTHTIRLNTDLAKKPPECLEYIVVHELAHLREPNHGERFRTLMDTLMPGWQTHRTILNQLPVRNETWTY